MSVTVAFQGIHGANSELAIHQQFGNDVVTLPCESLSMLFEVIDTHQVTYAMLPIENALAGAVAQAYELLMDHDLRIQADVVLHVHHALMARQGVSLDDLETVRSHPQALAQCEKFLRRHHIKPVQWYDTAGAAHDLSTMSEDAEHIGVLASEWAGDLYGLNVLQREVEDVPFNFTRFFVLGHEDPSRGDYNKTSIVFGVRNRPAALHECLGEFASRGINLTKLESRPRRNRPWEPVFFVDFEGHWQDGNVMDMMARLLQRASFVKMLGSYPATKLDFVGS